MKRMAGGWGGTAGWATAGAQQGGSSGTRLLSQVLPHLRDSSVLLDCNCSTCCRPWPNDAASAWALPRLAAS